MRASYFRRFGPAAALIVLACGNPSVYEKDHEFEYSWWALAAHFIFQEKLPLKPTSYEHPAQLYKSVTDPYTRYIADGDNSAKEPVAGLQQDLVGIALDSVGNGYGVTHVFHGGAARKAGIVEEDLIVGIDGVNTVEVSYDSIETLLQGAAGQSKTLRIRRGARDTAITVALATYDPPGIIIDSLSDRVAYIALTGFSQRGGAETVSETFVNALNASRWAMHTIFDLRSVGGDLGEHGGQSVAIASHFLPGAAAFMRKKWRAIIDSAYVGGTQSELVSPAVDSGLATQRKIMILTNESTSGAAEIIVWGIKAWGAGNGTIIGARTYGKATGYVELQSPEGATLRITNLFYEPVSPDSGVADSIYYYHDFRGIAPDVAAENGHSALRTALDLIDKGGFGKKGAFDGIERRIRFLRGRFIY